MQHTSYVYQNDNFSININKIPIWFKEIKVEGDKDNGGIVFHTQNDFDEAWGANGKMEVTWTKKGRLEFFHAKEVQNSIDVYNAIRIVVTDKNRIWMRSHEFTYWFGSRSKMIRKRYYPENVIHAVFYCDMTERHFDIHVGIIKKHYEGFKPYILEMFNSIICH